MYEFEDKKMSPDVDQSCVFPSEDGYGEHNGCRRIEDWEETGIPEWRIKLIDAVCSTEVDYAGLALSHRWGWCRPVFCPQEGTDSDTTWGIDETLTVTTHTVIEFDEDLYVMIPLLILLAFCLFSFSRTLRRHGTFMCRQIYFSVNFFITDEKISRVIRKVIKFFAKREERTDEENETELKVLAAALAIFISLNMMILVQVLTK